MAGLKTTIPHRPNRSTATFPSGWPSTANDTPSAAPSAVPSVPDRGPSARSVQPTHRDYAAPEAFCAPPDGADQISIPTDTSGISNGEWPCMCARCHTTFPVVGALEWHVNNHQCWQVPQNRSMILPGPEPHRYDFRTSLDQQANTTQTSTRATTGAFDTNLSFATRDLATSAPLAYVLADSLRNLKTHAVDVRMERGWMQHPPATRMAGGSVDASIAKVCGCMRPTTLEEQFHDEEEFELCQRFQEADLQASRRRRRQHEKDLRREMGSTSLR